MTDSYHNYYLKRILISRVVLLYKSQETSQDLKEDIKILVSKDLLKFPTFDTAIMCMGLGLSSYKLSYQNVV